jgi:hypothetical protein
VFRDCRLEEADFYGATLTSVLFERSPLTAATLSEATIERVELRGCELTGLNGAERLRGARMPWADIVASAGTFAATLGIVASEEPGSTDSAAASVRTGTRQSRRRSSCQP